MIKLLYLKFLLVVFLLFFFTSCTRTDWRENFKEKEKSPFGTYIIAKEVKGLFKNEKITFLKDNFYDFLVDETSKEANIKKNYILIKHNANKLTDKGIVKLLNFVKKGNSVFIALNFFNKDFKKQLEFTTNNLDKDVYSIANLKELQGTFYLKNKTFINQPYQFDRNIRRNYFLQYNKNKTIVLGTTEIDGEKVPNFIKIYHGKGAFYLHTNPVVFTNYYLLKNKENYTANVFSYLPNQKTIWDLHIKRSKFSKKTEDNKPSIFKFFLKHKTLTWFLVVSLVGLLLFMLFTTRRKQRAIPVIPPLKNTTVAFTQTISNLYLSEKDHKNLVDKKITFFLEKARTKYRINTANLNRNFIQKLAAKSGNEYQQTNYLINTIIALHKKSKCSEEELITLHKMIEIFFNK
ncbi:MAG: hypothetical protein ACWIPI_07700 [Polaribacter sp.]